MRFFVLLYNICQNFNRIFIYNTKKEKTKNHTITHSTTQIGVKKKTDKMPVFKKAKKSRIIII